MLIDSAHIQEQDALFVSKWRAKKHQPPVEPLYRVPDAEKAVKQLVGHPYDHAFSPVDGVTVTFRDAGHILGSAQVVLDVQEPGRKFRWLFSGDVGRGGDEILRDPVPVENVDYLQIESTYGGREHAVRTGRRRHRLPARWRRARPEGQGHHPVVFRRAHATDCLCAAPDHVTAAACRACRFLWTAR